MTHEITPARAEWFDRLSTIAAEGGSPDADVSHFEYLTVHGRLMAAVDDGEVVGFGGTTEVHGARMVTDLFVASAHHGRGIGSRLLAALLDGAAAAFTFSSTHPAALAAYRTAGLASGWPLLTMRGVASGGDGSAAGSVGEVTVQRVVGEGEPDAVMTKLLNGFAPGTGVVLSVPAHSPALLWLVLRDFRIVDVDIFCATPGFTLPEHLWVVHRGLC